MADERSCRIVNSRGLLKSCDVFPDPPVSSTRRIAECDWTGLPPGALVYVHASAMARFLREAWPRISVPIVLVSGDSDQTMPYRAFPSVDAFHAFVGDARLLHWFSQNFALRHRKSTQLPIGVDFHTLAAAEAHRWGPTSSPAEQEAALLGIARQAPAWPDRIPLAYCSFQFTMDTQYAFDRRNALARMAGEACFLEPQVVPRLASWQAQARYAFVISPHGGGLDCHRSWEALSLGCIPIVKRSPLDRMFAGLPVLIVDDWAEVTRERLEAAHADPPPTTRPEKLTLAYWVQQMRHKTGRP